MFIYLGENRITLQFLPLSYFLRQQFLPLDQSFTFHLRFYHMLENKETGSLVINER